MIHVTITVTNQTMVCTKLGKHTYRILFGEPGDGQQVLHDMRALQTELRQTILDLEEKMKESTDG